MSSTKVRIAILSTVILGLVFSYQNCSQHKANQGRSNTSLDGTDPIKVKGDADGDSLETGLSGVDKIDPQNITAVIRINDERRIRSITIPLENTNLTASSSLTNFEGKVDSISVETAEAELSGFKFTPNSTEAVISCEPGCVLKISPRLVYRLVSLDPQNSKFVIDIVSGSTAISLEGRVQVETVSNGKVTASDTQGDPVKPLDTPDCNNPPIMTDKTTWRAWVAVCGDPSANK